MERTPSGRTILTETTAANNQLLEDAEFSPEEDHLAALQVKWHMAKPRQNVKRHERILRALIHPKTHADKGTEFPLDNDALESIFSAANEIFFQGRLSRRVHWEWSSFETPTTNATEEEGNDSSVGGSGRGGGGIIGTTALRRASPPSRGGYETLIVLSSPILMDTGYNRRLLISTFLHELIHSYLFICCGFKARHCGGHTDGFKEIAATIEGWAGWGTLRLCDIEADLEHFREDREERLGGELDRSQAPIHQHCHQQQPQPRRNHHHHPVYQHQQLREQPPPQKRYHQHGGVDFYNLNESPWSTGPQVVFGSGRNVTLDFPTPAVAVRLSPSPPPPQPTSGCWNSNLYPTRTPISSPTPPPSMSTTPLGGVSGEPWCYGKREDVMYEFDPASEYKGSPSDGPGGSLMFMKPGIKYLSPM